MERRRVFVRLAGSASALMAALAVMYGSVPVILAGLSQSGFYEYASLATSDSGAVLAYWKEFALSLIEVLPLPAITIALVAVGVLLYSVRVFAAGLQSRRALAFHF